MRSMQPVFGVLVFLLFSGAILDATDATLRYKTVTFPGGIRIDAEIADTQPLRQKGLMFRDSLPRDRGMLFVFTDRGPHLFWMKNCNIPLDILWLDENKKVTHIAEATPPCRSDPCPVYGPTEGETRYVLEVVSGFSKMAGVKIGTRVQF